jgi:hypothetical protein
MKVFDHTKYDNLLGILQYDHKSVESWLSQYNLWFIRQINETVEKGMDLPMFVYAFYRYLYKQKCLPTQEQLYQEYIKHDYFKGKNLSEDIMIGIKARLLRAYPSLVRDIHFAFYVKEKNPNITALYSMNLDVKEGIDLLLLKDSKYYGVNLYTDTPRGKEARSWKTKRHEPFYNVQYIEFPVKFEESHRCGKFNLYGETEYNKLMELIA